MDSESPRREIEQAIAPGDSRQLLSMTAALHGHFCPLVAIGVKATTRAVKELGVSSTGMEELVAIVETNNCFSDGIQFVTGCSFGNNALIYQDCGKTALTLAKRDGEAVSVSVKADSRFLEEREPESTELFHKVVFEHQGTETGERRLKELWTRASLRIMDIPDDELFTLKRMTIRVPAYSRIFADVECSSCGEVVMEPRARIRDGKPACIPWSRQEYCQLAGDGMSLNRKEPGVGE